MGRRVKSDLFLKLPADGGKKVFASVNHSFGNAPESGVFVLKEWATGVDQ